MMDKLDSFHIYPPCKEPIEKVCKGGARKKQNITKKTTKIGTVIGQTPGLSHSKWD